MYRVAYDHILGVRPTYAGLLIDPAIPPDWKADRVVRVFRGARYLIEVENPDGVESGVKAVFVDGRPIAGDVLPVSAAPECRGRVVLGR